MLPLRPDPGVDPSLQALVARAYAQADACELDAAQASIDEVRAQARAAGCIGPQVHALVLASIIALRRSQPAEGMRAAAAARGLALSTGDAELLAHARLSMARVNYWTGANDEALTDLEAVWPIAEQSQDLRLRFSCANYLGIVVGIVGHHERGMHWCHVAQGIAERWGQPQLAATAAANAAGRHIDIGELADAQGRTDDARAAWLEAVRACEAALAAAQACAAREAQLIADTNRTMAFAYLDDHAEATSGVGRVRAFAAEVGNPIPPLHVALPYIRLLRRRGELGAAQREARSAIAQAEQISALHQLAPLYEAASAIDEALGNDKAALAMYKRFHETQNLVAAERTRLRAELLSVRLETEQALAEAETAQARAFELARENEALSQAAQAFSEQALRDPLTGLANRRRLDEVLPLAWSRARSQGAPLCLALLDADHFKRVNDTYSHAVGDAVLRELGALMLSHCREGDLAARFGGEEFVLLIPDTDLAGAQRLCERLRASIESWAWSSIAPGLAVTASLGVANIAEAEDATAGLARVDALLYEAKRRGRNRVIATLPSPP